MPNITIEGVRISYPNLFQAKQVNNQGDPKFSAAFIIPNTNPALAQLKALAAELVAKAHPNGKPHNFKELPICAGEVYQNGKHANNPAYMGHHVLNTGKSAAQGQPYVLDQAMNKILDPAAIYPGMIVNVALSVYTYSNISKGVTTGLEGVQIVRDGERLDSKPAAEELFKPIDVVSGGGGEVDPLG
ncbi:MAG: DUF2815 family protein [Candidatus Sabulitectum sp.]|nr:DUF2815 family protein [Candidatus Sabulitectum sp.]